MRAAFGRLCFLRSMLSRTNVYIDGFNLFYGAAKHTPYKWVNLAALCERVLPGIVINRLRYFTALVTPSTFDPQKRSRQEAYIRALETLPNLTVHYGHYLQSVVSMRLAQVAPGGSRNVEVVKMEEKGSDVNIATYMLVDAFRHDCDQLVVITNDSDLAEPIRIIDKELNIPVGVFNPHTKDTALRKSRRTGKREKAFPSVVLRRTARFYREIASEGSSCHMAQSQFPNELVDVAGRKIKKPDGW